MRSPAHSTTTRLLLGVLAFTFVLLGLPQAVQAAPSQRPGQSDPAGASADQGVVSINVSGFSFEDLDPRTTPHLWVVKKNAESGARHLGTAPSLDRQVASGAHS